MEIGPAEDRRTSFASPEDEAAAQRYIDTDIEYKYHPENVTELMGDPDPIRVVPAPMPTELYNIETDPLEMNNVAAEHPGRVVTRMLTELENWFEIGRCRARTGAYGNFGADSPGRIATREESP